MENIDHIVTLANQARSNDKGGYLLGYIQLMKA